MNHLAHALLAGDDSDWMLGGMLGDFVHGPVPGGLRPGVERGIRLHRAIDVYTDAHPIVVALRGRFVAPFRRYAGILVDVWFDHLLARDFAHWCDTPLAAFSDTVVALLRRHHDELPPNLQRFAMYMERAGLPAAYADSAVVDRALAGIGTRLSRANPLDQALRVLQALDAELHTGFAAFFPELRTFADDWRNDAAVRGA
jgi:acyl carrier protein phosphodiesterase